MYEQHFEHYTFYRLLNGCRALFKCFERGVDFDDYRRVGDEANKNFFVAFVSEKWLIFEVSII